jgi:putative membrane protein
MDYQAIKALHIIFVVSWFAGLFYMVRLFIYHVETKEKPEHEAKILTDQFKIMQQKLWWIITTPAMVLTVIFGVWLLVLNPYLLLQPWMHIKLTFIVLLLVYHFICQRTMNQLKRDEIKWSSTQLRLWNELATLFLVAVVFLVEMQTTMSWLGGIAGFFGVGVSLMIAVKLYKNYRNKKNTL